MISKRIANFRVPLSRSFQFLKDADTPAQTPQFMVGFKNGFLPRQDPLKCLPQEFSTLESLLQRMPVHLPDGSEGLLAKGLLGEAVKKELKNYKEEVQKVTESKLLMGLFRDYTFLASAYLLEPCDLHYRKHKDDYGLGRDVLPSAIAQPLCIVADKIGARPFMEYAQSYSLYNWQRVDPKGGLEYKNLKLIRALGGHKSEHGFILVHVAMVAHSGELVKHFAGCLEAAEVNQRGAFNENFAGVLATMQKINQVMDTMYQHSLPADYLKFRTFIMGTYNQPMFPNGVIYEGVDTKPKYYRGESGANDSMIPLCDNFLQLTEEMPHNPLTEILKDFRSYRPANHNAYLKHVEGKASSVKIKSYCLGDAKSGAMYLALLDQVREFSDERARHWNFTKDYIIKYTKHEVATGGSPIVSWLPNQLSVVLNAMVNAHAKIKKEFLSQEDRNQVEILGARAATQIKVLAKEVEDYKKVYKNQ